jgi:DMSO/TMAO reductase YedYZ molybdopterin-dependent catalytic subunit
MSSVRPPGKPAARPERARRRRTGARAQPWRPPGPFRPDFWRSPLRGTWLTAVLGTVLLGLVGLVALTGFLSHAAYQPDLGRNALVRPDLPFTTFFDWPTGPSWLYALTQGLHVNAGLVAIPVLLAKLWSVIPRLFVWPPARTPAEAVERAAVALLVASTGFLFATGVANIQYWYVFDFDFVKAHYYAAVVFVAALAIHLVVKLPLALRAYRTRGVLAPLRVPLAETRPDAGDRLAAVAPDPPTVSRRGLLAGVGAGSLALLVANAGESIGGPLRATAFLAPRREGGFPVNKTAAAAKVTEEMAGAGYRLVLRGGPAELRLSREELLALPQATETLTLGCVEGWSTRQTWTGVPLAELARRAGVPEPSELTVESLQPAGVLRQATLSAGQVADSRSLLALKVGGADLSMDHGYPARVIVPALPGVHNTKWVGRLTFRA